MTLWQPLRRTIAWDGGEAVLEVEGPGAARVTLNCARTRSAGRATAA